MAKSFVTYTGDGSTTTYAVTFPYLAKLHVNVLIGGESLPNTEWSWLTDSSISLNVPTMEIITIVRVTPTVPIVDFTDGSVLTENQLDIATIQSLYVAEETQDAVAGSIGNQPGGELPDGTPDPNPGDGVNWNAQGKKLIHLAEGTNSDDAINKAQLDAAAPILTGEVNKAKAEADRAEDEADRAQNIADTLAPDVDAANNAAINAKNSEDQAKLSENAAKASENAAALSASEANASQVAAKASEDRAKVSETNARDAEVQAKGAAADAALAAESVDDVVSDTSDLVDEATDQAVIATNAATTATASKTAAKASEDAAKASELQAKAHADAIDYDSTLAQDSAAAAKVSEDNAKVSETNAEASAVRAENANPIIDGEVSKAEDAAAAAEASAVAAKSSEDEAEYWAAEAKKSEGATGYTKAEMDDILANMDAVPPGLISIWSGAVAAIPDGWALCDGASGTPDLRDKFVVGAGSTYAVDATGGSKDAAIIKHKHTLSGSAANGGAHTHGFSNLRGSNNAEKGRTSAYYAGWQSLDGTAAISTSSGGGHTHTLSGNTSEVGSSGTNKNLPPYYALAYIMKLSSGA